MNRTPNKTVRTTLAEEVGFGCPVRGCGSPYLTWHHFDPPWNVRQHHDPAGMVALCGHHHDAADAGAYTPDELQDMKVHGRDRAHALTGRFEWRRQKLLAVIGGNFYYETPIPLQLRDHPVICFNRDNQCRFLLNVAMPSAVPEPRLWIDDNFWVEIGTPRTVECPPSGKLVHITYANGDLIRVEFFDIKDGDTLSRRYRHADLARRSLEEDEDVAFPLTAVEIRMRLVTPEGRPAIDFDAQQTRIGGMQMAGSFVSRCAVGVQLA